MTPFDFWTGMWRSGAAMVETAMTVGETLSAANTVIDSRVRSMKAAARDPIGGDYAELGRMVPEKVDAFSKAGAAAFGDLQALQMEALASWHHMIGIAARGRVPTVSELSVMTSRSARMTERATAAAGKALAPIHRTATGNARRLKKRKKAPSSK